MRKILPFLFAAAATFFKTNSVCAQPGTLDSTFGENGKVSFGGANLYVAAVVMQTDGKICAAGSRGYDYGDSEFVIARFFSDGKVDSSFGVDGKAATSFGANFYSVIATSVIIQPDRKIVVGGFLFSYGDPQAEYFALVRYKANGSLDSNFGNNGKVITFLAHAETEMNCLALQADGKILAAGNCDGFCIVRYLPKGKLDSSFGTNGIITKFDFFSINELAIQPDGKIIAGGSAPAAEFSNNYDFGLSRLLANGTVDSSFGTNGRNVFDFYGGQDGISSISILKNGNIVAAGNVYNSNINQYEIGLAKYTINGDFDSSFGVNGKIVTTAGENSPSVNKLIIQQDGRFITAGSILARFKTEGNLDSTYGTNGKATNFAGAADAVLQPDQNVVECGNPYFTIGRYKGDATRITIAKNISVSEGDSGYTNAQFKITMDHSSASIVKVHYKTKDGTAQAGSDYVSTSGTVTIKPGILSKMVSINVIGDNAYESNEKFSLVLSNPVNALLGDLDSATCTIKNDDPLSAESQTNNDASFDDAGIKVYPNPVKDELNVERITVANATISIVDMQGRKLIETTAGEETKTIDVKKLAPGVYCLRIESANAINSLKFVKQ